MMSSLTRKIEECQEGGGGADFLLGHVGRHVRTDLGTVWVALD